MSKEATIWIVIAIYAIFMVVIGVVNSKNSGGMASFTVGGRNAGAWISALSYGTAYFSAVMFIGYSGGSGWSYGLYATLVGIEMRCSVPSGVDGVGGAHPRGHAASQNQIHAPAL